MPTSRPRHQVTETAAVSSALDLAAEQWPDEPRSKLLVRLLHTGAAVLQGQRGEGVLARRRAVEATSGKYAETYDARHLGELREDWPE